MAKDTPNKPDDVKVSPSAEHPEQASPVADPLTAENPSVDETVVSTDEINGLSADKPKATKPEQADRAEQGQKAPDGKAVQTGEKAAHTPEQASAPSAVNPILEAGTSTLSADEDFRAEWEIPLAELEERRKQEKKARRSSSKKAPAAKEAEADKPKPEAGAAEKPDKPADKVIPLHPSDSGDKLRREQEDLLRMLDEKDSSLSRLKGFSQVKTKPSSSAKAQPTKDSPELAERKRKLEKELREKYGIPKSDTPAKPWVAPEEEKVVRIPHEKLHSFKRHTFNVEKNAKFTAFVASIRAHGVTQPVIVRPDGKDTYEIISGHRRDLGGIEAGIPYSPCIVRALNDEQAIQQMVEDNVNNRDISTMELARSLKAQLDSIKRQGVREALAGKDLAVDTDEKVGKRSNEIIAERNGMSVKQVQRHIALTNLTPALQEYVDGKTAADGKKTIQIGFVPAVELSYVKPENQNYIALAIEGQQSTPSLSQAQRLRELDKKGLLNPDVIDGILMEEKKEADKVILSSQELSEYFGKDKTPREMKDTILKLLGEWKKQQKELAAPEKKDKQPEK